MARCLPPLSSAVTPTRAMGHIKVGQRGPSKTFRSAVVPVASVLQLGAHASAAAVDA